MVFDRYFKKSLEERTGSGKGEGLQYLFEGDYTGIPHNIARSFIKNIQNKNKLNKYLSLKLLKPHQGDQIMNEKYRNTSLSFPSSVSDLDTQLSLRPCKAEGGDQHLVRHTLNLINNAHKNIFVRTIDTNVLVLLISYIGQFEVNDIEIYAYVIN